MDNNELEALLNENSVQTLKELADQLGVDESTIFESNQIDAKSSCFTISGRKFCCCD